MGDEIETKNKEDKPISAMEKNNGYLQQIKEKELYKPKNIFSLITKWIKGLDREKIAKKFYEHRWGSSFVIIFLSIIGMMLIAKLVILGWVGVDNSDKAYGTMLLAITSLPALGFVWFIKNYERTIELDNKRKDTELKETAQWKKEFNELLLITADDSHKVKQNIAIVQLQDYLTGRKNPQDIKANTAAIFKAISMGIDKFSKQTKGLKSNKQIEKIEEIKNQTIIKTIGDTLRACFVKHEIKISNNTLAGLNLSYLDLENINFNGLDMNHCKLQHATLLKTNLQNSFLSDAKLQKADLTRADLQKANLIRADLRGAVLQGVNLQEAMLYEADLLGADLQSADLEFAALQGTDLQGTDLLGTNLLGVDLYRADLLGARNLEFANFNKDITLSEVTGLPDWFDPEKPYNGHPNHQDKNQNESPVAD